MASTNLELDVMHKAIIAANLIINMHYQIQLAKELKDELESMAGCTLTQYERKGYALAQLILSGEGNFKQLLSGISGADYKKAEA